MTKSTRLETDIRVETVRQFILRGDETSDIVRAATETWGVKDRQAWYYIGKAREKIQELTELAKPYLIAEHIAVRRDIRMRAQKAGDLRAELAAAQDEAKLFGLYPSESPGVSVTVNNQTAVIGVVPVEYRNGLASLAPGSVRDSDAPGPDETAVDGAPVGQDGLRWDIGAERPASAWAGGVDRPDL